MRNFLPETTIERKPLHLIRCNGMPKGQPRPRAFSRGGKAAVYDPGTAEGWKGAVALACSALEGRALHCPLSVTLTFYLPRPKGHYRSNGQLKPSSPVYLHDNKPDADNLAKAVLDALTNIRAWLDDDQVCELVVRKYWEQPKTHAPGCMIRINELREVEL
jgi:Holliday junction resolvase RusA-like endonuclease